MSPIALGLAAGTAPSASSYEAGAVICGKYRLDELLGEGGMGSVWRATNSVTQPRPASNANRRAPTRRPQNRWLIAIAVLAVAFGGAWSAAGNARPERSTRLLSAPRTIAAVVPSVTAQPAPSVGVAKIPAPAAVKSVPSPVARRLPSVPAQRAASPADASAPIEPKGEARSASLDLIAPY